MASCSKELTGFVDLVRRVKAYARADVRDGCGASLRGPEGETYVQKLVWALRHRDAATALRAATILGHLGASEATEALVGVLRAPGRDPYLRSAAARGLGSVGDPAVRAALVKALECGPVMVRLAAVGALEALGPDEEAARVLRRAAQDRSLNVREEASEVLARWSDAEPARERAQERNVAAKTRRE